MDTGSSNGRRELDGRREWVPVSEEEKHESPEGRARIEGVQAAEGALDREPVRESLRTTPCERCRGQDVGTGVWVSGFRVENPLDPEPLNLNPVPEKRKQLRTRHGLG